MKFLSNFYIILLFGIFVFASCNKCEEPKIEEPLELITTLTYTLAPSDGSDPVVLSFQDTDGDGGNDAVTTTSSLSPNVQYTGTITLLNESIDPVEDIGLEVADEDDEHQMFFQTSGIDLTIEYTDGDSNGNPLGLSTSLTTGDAGSGDLTITLRHEPDKDGTGVSDGDITNAGGETDIEVTFPIIIQ